MQQVRTAGSILGALAMVVVLGFTLLGVPGVVAQRGGGEPAPPTEFGTLCVNVHSQVVRAISSGACQSHESTVNTSEDLPLTLCVNSITKVARAISEGADCAPSETVAVVTGFEDFSICVNTYTAVVRVPDPARCQASEITGVISGLIGRDSYASLPNVGLDVPASDGLLANDGPGVEIVSADAASELGGDVTVNPDGSFTYLPAAGITGADAFTYIARVGDSEIERPVEITVEGPMIWFVDNGAPSVGDGRLSSPFDQIDAVNDDGADPDGPGDIIFLFSGIDNYGGGLALEEGQMLIGQCLDLVATAAIVVPPFSIPLPEVPVGDAGCEPFLENVVGFGNVVDLAPDTFVGGLSLVFGDHGIAGADFTGDVEIREVSVNLGPSGEDAVNLLDIDGTVTIIESNLAGGFGGATEFGGDGIDAENVTLVEVFGGQISGGDGGDTGVEDVPAGDGGAGIRLVHATVNVSAATVIGGDGGNQTVNVFGGFGGDGIRADEDPSVTFTGGSAEGGDGGSAAGSLSGDGGSGLFIVDGGTADVVNAALRGGEGAPAAGGNAGDGGRGLFALRAGTVSVTDSVLDGGPGADSGTSIAGSGGDGLSAFETEFVTVTGSTLTGDVGGATGGSISGAGGSGIFSRMSSILVHDSALIGALSGGEDRDHGYGLILVTFNAGDLILDIQDNILVGAGDSPSVQVGAFDATVCLTATGNSGSAGGPPDGGFELFTSQTTPTLSISQASLDELIADNNGVTVDASEELAFGCSGG